MEIEVTEQLLTTREAADYLRVHWMTVSQWCKNGVIPGAKVGKNWRIKRADLDKWFKGRVRVNGKQA